MRGREGEIIRSFPSQGFAKPNVYEHEKCAQSRFAHRITHGGETGNENELPSVSDWPSRP